MLTKINIRNFKTLKHSGDILLNSTVVLIGPNNSGKTTALQALMLWQLGLQKWLEKRANGRRPQQRTGVLINRLDLFSIPIKSAKMIWNDMFVSESERDELGKIKGTKKVNINIEVEGLSDGQKWKCALEFEYRDDESLYVRPLVANKEENTVLSNPGLLETVNVTFLPPMSGLKFQEEKLLLNTIEARIGEGRTAEVLRNICYQVVHPESSREKGDRVPENDWTTLSAIMKSLFFVDIQKPSLNSRGEIEMFYKDQRGNKLEVVSAGRGFQQILLLFSYLLSHPHSTLLLDEPDAHLEILKQQEVYNLIKKHALASSSQIIAASHSEVVLNEAVNEDEVIAFYPTSPPHKINTGKEIVKALKEYGFEHYYLANQNRWVLYLEGSTDLDILKAFAEKLEHQKAIDVLNKVYVHYLNQNDPAMAKKHFTGLKDASPPLVGLAIYDSIPKQLNDLEHRGLKQIMWNRREAENYFFSQQVFLDYARGKMPSDMFEQKESETRQDVMREVLADMLPGLPRRDPNDAFWKDEKAGEVMEKVFGEYFKRLSLPVRLSKNKYYEMLTNVAKKDIDPEVVEKLDAIVEVADSVAKSS